MATTDDRGSRKWRSRLPKWLSTWLRMRELNRDVRELDDHYRPLAAKATGNDKQRILSEWSFETGWPRSELGVLESERLRRLADRHLVDSPRYEQDDQTGDWYIPDGPRMELRRRIRDARRATVGHWIQAIAMPLIGLLGSLSAVISLLLR